MINRIKWSLHNAENGITNLPNDVFNIQGFSSPKFRIFLNKLISFPNTKYLEIGVWRGSTFCSAMYGNSPEYSVAIDNFSQLWTDNNPKNSFLSNTNKFIESPHEFYDTDCFSFDINTLKHKINVYLYDGDHKAEDHYRALVHYGSILEDKFIFICDDWNWMDVRIGTYSAIRDLNYKIEEEWTLPAKFNGDETNWWNGCWIAIMNKT